MTSSIVRFCRSVSVVDAVSWGILLEDLWTAYAPDAVLQPKTTSFQAWSQRLAAYADSPEARAEMDAWLALVERDHADLPAENKAAPDTVADARTIAHWLEAADTRLLLTEVPAAYDVKVNELLIAALTRSLAAWTGNSSIRIA